jgi:hypothetical protein
MNHNEERTQMRVVTLFASIALLLTGCCSGSERSGPLRTGLLRLRIGVGDV